MSTRLIRGWVILMALVLAALACNFSVSTARISDAYLAADAEGNLKTTTFAPTDTFYAIVNLANAPDDTVVKAVWTAVSVNTGEQDVVVNETETTTGDSLYFELSRESPWPAGQYKIDIYLNDELDRTLTFAVEGDSTPPTPELPAATISDAYLAKDNGGANRTNVFSPNDVIYAIVTLQGPDNTVVKTSWVAVNVQGEAPNTVIDEVETTSGNAVLPFSLTPSQAWPVGVYKVDLYLNGLLDRSLQFEVQGGEPVVQPPASNDLIQRAYLARDEDGQQQVSIFAPTDIFYAIVEMPNAPADTLVKAVWYAAQVTGVDADTLLDETEITGSGTFTFNLSNTQLWPTGLYRVEIFVNGELASILELEVR